ncbi:MAG: outer membrane beta-barrel protein [Nitrospinae bacterium]|nr:outer membrane beta-barrel protein [Nitrospinota bacterium]
MLNHTFSKAVGATIGAFYFCVIMNTPIFGQDQEKYFGIGFGTSTIDIDTTGADQVKDSDTAIKILFGFRNTENSAVEIAYADLGEASAHFTFAGVGEETDRFEAKAISVVYLGSMEISPTLSFFGKIGFAFWMLDASADGVIFGTPISGSGSGTGFDPTFGIGLAFGISDNSLIRIAFERYLNVGKGVTVTFPGLGSVDLDGADVDVIGVTLIFKL